MPLIIGIENGIEKGFTEEELEFTNGFPLGVLCMTAGVGAVIPPYMGKYGNTPKRWNEKDFLNRIRITNQHCKIFMNKNGDAIMPSMFNLDFVERMEEAGWSCNVGFKPTKEWKADMARVYFEKLERQVKLFDEEE